MRFWPTYDRNRTTVQREGEGDDGTVAKSGYTIAFNHDDDDDDRGSMDCIRSMLQFQMLLPRTVRSDPGDKHLTWIVVIPRVKIGNVCLRCCNEMWRKQVEAAQTAMRY